MNYEMNFADVMRLIAQGAINVTEGITTVEQDSPVHRAMKKLCEMVSKGEVTPEMLKSQMFYEGDSE